MRHATFACLAAFPLFAVGPAMAQTPPPGTLEVPDGIKLKSVDVTVSLESLSFFLAQDDEE